MNPFSYIDKLLNEGGPRVHAVLSLLAGFTFSFACVWMVVKANPAMGSQFAVVVGALAGLGGGTYIAAKLANKTDGQS